MYQSLRTAACTGNVCDLYALIERDGNVLKRFDEVEFVETPLHVAAEQGCIAFALEIMSLKPSFARKLNHRGLSPLHLAVENGHKEIALRILEIDKDLARIRGKNGETPLHWISKVGNNHDGLLDGLLKACPDSIRDVTTQNRTALHIAMENRRLNVLQVLTETLRKNDNYREVVNRKDEDGNTAMHLAARTNQPQMLKLLLRCKADKYATNKAGSTPLDIGHQHDNIESISILCGCFIPGASNFIQNRLKKRVVKHFTKASSLIFHDMNNISDNDRNSLLVILGLLLTATYQAALSPPGGVWQEESTYSSRESYYLDLGQSVLKEDLFLLFYIPTYIVFIVTFFLTLALLKPFPHGLRTAIQVLLAFLAICFDVSISIIAPTFVAVAVIKAFTLVVFILMTLTSIPYQVSKLGTSILGCWLSEIALYQVLGEPRIFGFPGEIVIVIGLFEASLLFVFLYDEFWESTIVVVGYCLSSMVFIDPISFPRLMVFYFVVLGYWLFLNLCKLCISLFSMRCNTLI